MHIKRLAAPDLKQIHGPPEAVGRQERAQGTDSMEQSVNMHVSVVYQLVCNDHRGRLLRVDVCGREGCCLKD